MVNGINTFKKQTTQSIRIVYLIIFPVDILTSAYINLIIDVYLKYKLYGYNMESFPLDNLAFLVALNFSYSL